MEPDSCKPWSNENEFARGPRSIGNAGHQARLFETVTPAGDACFYAGMSNVLADDIPRGSSRRRFMQRRSLAIPTPNL